MAETELTLRNLFQADASDISVRVETGVDVYQETEKIQAEIRNTSRAVRWGWVRDLIAQKSVDILDLNVIDVLLDTWKKYMQVEKFVNESRSKPAETFLCPLAEHTVTSKHKPYIEILIADRPAGRIEFSLEFSLTLKGFALKIQNGAVLEVETGSGEGEAALSLADTVLFKRDFQPVRFPGRIRFAGGIPLGRQEGRAALAGSPD